MIILERVQRKQVYQTTLMLCGFVILSTLISWLLGFQGFLLIGNLAMPPIIEEILDIVIFMIGLTAMTGVAINEYSFKLCKIMLLYLPIHTLLALLIPETTISILLLSTIFPFIYIMILGFIRKDLKNTFLRWIKYSLILLVLQYALSLIKTAGTALQLSFSIFQILAYSVDSLIIQALLFLYGGEERHHENVKETFHQLGPLERFTSTRRKSSDESINESSGLPQESVQVKEQLREEFNSRNKWEQMFVSLFYIGIQILQCFVVLFICGVVGNVFFEAFCILVSFILNGLIINQRWPSKSILACTIVSTSMFYLAAKLTPSFFLFQLFPILIGLLMVVALYRIYILHKRRTFDRWFNNVVNLISGKYSEIGNHQEVAIAKLPSRDMGIVGYSYQFDDFGKFLNQISPWSRNTYEAKKWDA